MKRNNQQDKTPHPEYSQYNPKVEEINLLDIWRVLVRQKWLILGIIVLCTMLSVGLALKLPREYRAKVIMLPPLPETVEKLNVPNIDDSGELYFFEVKSQELYNDLIENLQSSRLQRQFFDENNLVRFLSEDKDNLPPEVIFEDMFREKFAVSGMEKRGGKREFVTITLDGKNPEQIANWLNSFVSLADKEAIMEQTRSFLMKVQRTKDSVSQRIESLRYIGQARRLDIIAQLEEAVIIAKKLGWVEGPENLGALYEQVKENGPNMSFSLQEMPLYWRGSKALQAEINVLKQRQNDDPFIPGLRDLQERCNFLSSLKQNADNVHAMRIDRPATADKRPIKPNKKLIVVLGFVFGLLFSVFTAFIRNMIVTAKRTCVEK